MNCPQCGNIVKEQENVCSLCGEILSSSVINSLPKKQPKKKLGIIIFLSLVFCIGIAIFFKILVREYHPIIKKQPTITVQETHNQKEKIQSHIVTSTIHNDKIIISLDTLQHYSVVRFFDPENVQKIPILAYITPKGKIVTAMSLSENCRSEDFYLEGKTLHCGACPSYWDMESLEAYACCPKYYPDPIPSKVVNNEIHIDKKIVQVWKARL